jgi:hypothetical protein
MSPTFKISNNIDKTFNISLIEKTFENNEFIYILSKYKFNLIKSLTLDKCIFNGRDVLTSIRHKMINNEFIALENISFKNTISIDEDDNKLACLFAIMTNGKSVHTLEISDYDMIDTVFMAGLWQPIISYHLKVLILERNILDDACTGHIRDMLCSRETKLSVLRLSNNTYPGIALVFIIMMLKSIKTIYHIILDEPTIEMCGNTLDNLNFKGITLRTTTGSNNNTTAGDFIALHAHTLVKNPDCVLERLEIINYPMNPYRCRLLLSGLEINSTLTHIDLTGANNIGDEVASIMKNKQLVSLRLSRCGLDSRIVTNLLHNMSKGLKELDLSHNFIGRLGARQLSLFISKEICVLETLYINDCLLCEVGLVDIIQSIYRKPCIKDLNISNNNISRTTILEIGNMLTCNIIMCSLVMTTTTICLKDSQLLNAYRTLYTTIEKHNTKLIYMSCDFKVFERLMIRNRRIYDIKDDDSPDQIMDDLNITENILGHKRHIPLEYTSNAILCEVVDNENFYEICDDDIEYHNISNKIQKIDI